MIKRFVDLVFASGFGITLHAVANELYYKGGFWEIVRPQGEYIGLIIMMVAYAAFRYTQTKEDNAT